MDFQPDRATVIIIRQRCQHLPELIAVVSYHVRQQQQLDGTIKRRFGAGTRSLGPSQAVHCHGSGSGRASPRSPRGAEALPLLAAAAPPGGGGSRQQAGGAPRRGGFLRMGKLGTNEVCFVKLCLKDSLLEMFLAIPLFQNLVLFKSGSNILIRCTMR